MRFEEFADLVSWWNHREENERAWKVPASELLANNCNLDRKNPRSKEDITHLPPDQLAASILQKEQRIAEIIGQHPQTCPANHEESLANREARRSADRKAREPSPGDLALGRVRIVSKISFDTGRIELRTVRGNKYGNDSRATR